MEEQLAELAAQVAALEAKGNLTNTMFAETYYYLTIPLMIIIHAGFLAYEMGASRAKNALSSGVKNILAFAFVIRDLSRHVGAREPGPSVDGEAMQNVIDLVGSAPLKELVAATADVVERMCIETAVQLTNNNRAAAAEMLGLSRQSLYVKLRKYNLIGRSDDA